MDDISIDDKHKFDDYVKWLASLKFMIIVSCLFCVAGIACSLCFNDMTLFPRFGCLITIAGLFLVSSPVFVNGIYISQASIARWAGVGSDGKTSVVMPGDRIVGNKVFAGIVITLIGTLIWGFGDLWLGWIINSLK